MNGDVLSILKMVEDGKLDTQKAEELIWALNEPPVFEQAKRIDNSCKMLRIRVVSGDNDKVSVNLSINFIETVLGAVGKIPLVWTEWKALM